MSTYNTPERRAAIVRQVAKVVHYRFGVPTAILLLQLALDEADSFFSRSFAN